MKIHLVLRNIVMVKILLSIIFVSLLISSNATAETIFVTDSLKLKLRVTPSNDGEVITSLDSGQKLSLIEKQRKFSQVKTADGNTGWVQSWFLTDKPPATYIVNSVTKENEILTSKLAKANAKLKNFDSETSRENETLNKTVASLTTKIKSLTTTRNDLEDKLDSQAGKLAKYEFAEKYNINLIILVFFLFSFAAGFLSARIWSQIQERKRLWGYQLAH